MADFVYITPISVDNLHHSGHNAVFVDKEGRVSTPAPTLDEMRI